MARQMTLYSGYDGVEGVWRRVEHHMALHRFYNDHVDEVLDARHADPSLDLFGAITRVMEEHGEVTP